MRSHMLPSACLSKIKEQSKIKLEWLFLCKRKTRLKQKMGICHDSVTSTGMSLEEQPGEQPSPAGHTLCPSVWQQCLSSVCGWSPTGSHPNRHHWWQLGPGGPRDDSSKKKSC